MRYVVGSGPSGVACAVALLAKGHAVTMLDVGLELDPARRAQVQALAQLEPRLWTEDAVAPVKQSVHPDAGGIPLKTVFGSDYPYRGTDQAIPVERHGVHLLPSFAQGGLSTVWGAAMLPFRSDDIADWPLTPEELAPHYASVLNFVPLSAAADDLEPQFPLYSNAPQTLKPSAQGADWIARLTRGRAALNAAGIIFGRSRLAVRGEHPDRDGCRYCGLCMYGCPYDHIYGADQTLAELRKSERFSYRSGVVVRRVSESGGGVRIDARDFRTRERLQLDGDRVYLAAGVLPTTRILLESLEAWDRPRPMASSQHFMFPLWRDESTPRVRREPVNTLAQVFLEVSDPEVGPHRVHLQVYTYNDLYLRVLRRMGIGYALALIPGAMDQALGRLMIVQGYLHSRDTGAIETSLRRAPGENAEPSLVLRARRRPDVPARLHRLLKKLTALRRELGARPLGIGLKLSPLGQGFHNGGTFPMRKDPQALESDRWGRPRGLKRVFAVDATVLPSIPATTVTLGTMANAHRIGSLDD